MQVDANGMIGKRQTAAPRGAAQRWRRTQPAEVRVDDLMSAAAALFIAKGIEATTIDDIVARAGVAKGTFYHYFSTKADVIIALRARPPRVCVCVLMSSSHSHVTAVTSSASSALENRTICLLRATCFDSASASPTGTFLARA